ncbi:U2-type spliceosomal complex subunit cwc23 [Diatrype stigma]|uniref:U2-type spliceosomal complex subunit cwc23 n=1 Tax=Diatrype stigma TaxID=117547 RepID=A0AAN9YR69_9PEZI
MPSAPTCDYYAELQVGQNATTEEVTASYRRLARIHHPDKNPGNLEQATAAFQKIALAYEVLSDPAQRTRYDARSSFGPARQGPATAAAGSRSGSSPYHAGREEDDGTFPRYHGFDDFFFHDFDEFVYHDFDEFVYHHSDDFLPRHHDIDGFFARYFQFTFNSRSRTEADKRQSEVREQFEAAQRERRARELAEAERRRAREAAKKADEDARTEAKAGRRAAEQAKQEARWEMLGARTADAKRDVCLHSDFCAKVTHKQKVKCDACAAKRGMTAFECPYCATSLCQLCVTNFGARRAKVEKMPKPEPEIVTEPEPVFHHEPFRKAGETKKAGNSGGRFKKGRFHSKTGRTSTRACYHCGREGHQARDCPDRNKPKPQQEQKKKDGNANANAENGTRK